MSTTYGSVVSASLAQQVLDFAGIPASKVGISIDGLPIEYGGKVYYILERDVWYPASDESPDGWHLVYSPSKEEEENRNPETTPGVSELLSKFMNVALLGIGVYFAVNLISGYKALRK